MTDSIDDNQIRMHKPIRESRYGQCDYCGMFNNNYGKCPVCGKGVVR